MQLFKSCLALMMKMSGHKRYTLSTLSGRERCREINIHIKLAPVIVLFLVMQPKKNFTEESFREITSFALLLLRTILSAR